jgi:hypothetical protein
MSSWRGTIEMTKVAAKLRLIHTGRAGAPGGADAAL